MFICVTEYLNNWVYALHTEVNLNLWNMEKKNQTPAAVFNDDHIIDISSILVTCSIKDF